MFLGILAILQLALANESATPDAYHREVLRLVLEGRDLPRDYRANLLAMSPGDRLLALALLRRAGLLTGPSWRIEDLLISAPSEPFR
jgi:hypothetical protein